MFLGNEFLLLMICITKTLLEFPKQVRNDRTDGLHNRMSIRFENSGLKVFGSCTKITENQSKSLDGKVPEFETDRQPGEPSKVWGECG